MATFTPWCGARSSLPWSSQGAEARQVPEAGGPGEHRWEAALPTAESVQHAVHVVLPAQALEEGDEVQQLCVRHVIEPGLHRHCILGVEDVRGGGVVHDDHLAQLPSKATQVFHVVPTMEDTRLSEEPSPEHTPAVQQVSHRVCVLGQAGSKEHTLEELSHPLEELVHVGPLQHIHLMYCSINFNWNNKVGIANRLKGTVHQCFI